MKYPGITEIFLSFAFILMILAPTAVDLAGERESTAATENRTLAKRPDPRLALDSFPDFTAQFERYYDDSFGLRERLIRWNNLLRLDIFNESPVSGVRLGRDGWLFYADEFDLEDYENVMPYTAEDLSRIRTILEERRLWLEKRGIKFFVLIAPNKHTIYSEYLPPAIHKIGKESRLDQVAEYLSAYPEIEFIDVRQALFEAKAGQRLYHKTDTHWNDCGAFIGYVELMERIGKYFPNARKLTLKHFNVTSAEEKGGDLARMLSLSDILKEDRISLIPRFAPRATDGARDYPNPAHLPGRDMVVKETHDPRLLRALVFRDSFSWPLIPYLAESFQSVVFAWTFDFLPEIIEKEKPDVVILESVERYINSLTLENPAELKAVFTGEDNPGIR